MISSEEPGVPGESVLPAPRRSDRWQPLRSGMLNLYRYDYEEFHFEDGRLLLRGNNGSGKSRVLALQLPFLIDGEVSAARLEPDGASEKRIEWNLLMGRYPDRTGYTWIEFGRRDEDGTAHFLTLGCGLRAVAGHSGLHSRWFFVTSQRIGRELFLQNHQRTPLSREKLEAALDGVGRVILKVEDYRRAVDEALFGLGPRFGPLVELLLRLRRPQLSRKLEEEELSNALSDALPTLPAAIVDDVAESFSSLQTDRGTLREFVAAGEAVTVFLREYAGYMRVAVRRRASAIRTTHAAYESAQRAVRDAERRLTAAAEALATLERQHADYETQLAGVEAAVITLRASPEMKTADEVRLAREAATAAANAFALAGKDETAAATQEERARENEQQTAAQASQVEQEFRQKLRVADAAALAADLAESHREQTGLPESEISDLKFETVREAALRRVLTQRDRAIAVLQAHEKKTGAAELAFQAADAERLRAEANAGAAREAEHAAREALAEAARGVFTNYVTWRKTLRHLRPADADALAEGWAHWSEQRTGPSPLRAAIEDAHRVAIATFARRESGLRQLHDELVRQMAEFDAVIDRIESGDTPPPPPPALSRAERTGRPGAPLWRLCDFRLEVDASARAGLEAALQASGLLDAWVLPDGRLLDATDDTFLLEGAGDDPASHHLGEALVPAIDREDAATRDFDARLIERLLSRVGWGEGAGEHWVAADGRWRLGPLAGRARKASADYIGETTRAEHRRRQLEELRKKRTDANDTLERTLQDLATLGAEREQGAREWSEAPSDEPVLRAGFELEAAARAVGETFTASERAARDAADKRATRDSALAARDRDAADLQLTGWVGRLPELVQAMQAYAMTLAALWPTARHWMSVASQHAAARARTAEAAAEHQSRRRRREEAEAAAEAARQKFSTLEEMHGETVAVVMAKLAAEEANVIRLKTTLQDNQRQQLAQTAARAQASGDQTTAEQQRAEHEQARRSAIASLQRLAEQRLLAEADPALREIDAGDWSVSQAVDFVRHRLDPLLADVADDATAWQRRQDAIHGHIQELRDRLVTHGHQPEAHQFEDIVLVRCVFQARPHTMTELRDAFGAEISERERLLQAKEQEIIENHLLAEAAVELTKLIRAAETWRLSANQELETRPTSSGVRFRFQWEPDKENRFDTVRPILLRKGELWTPAERAALAAFLQGRIAAEQTADETGSWRDHLARALDYRRWHRFVVERQQDGKWQRLNRATYGTGSGGEKALALTLPRFAAAAAHYRSAASTAPRLVMLDEAFAGIDPTMRAQCMGVLAQFDLDFVMTSELEWGCYRTVPSLAIYHLTTLPGFDAVAATRWIWNGRERRQTDPVLPSDRAPREANDEMDLPPADESAS